MTHIMEWSRPPAKQPGRGVDRETESIRESLRARPGEWAKIAETEQQNEATAIRNRLAQARGATDSRKAGFTVTTRKIDGKIHVWARFDPEEAAE